MSVTEPDFEQWALSIIRNCYGCSPDVSEISEGLKQSYEQGIALGDRQGYERGLNIGWAIEQDKDVSNKKS